MNWYFEDFEYSEDFEPRQVFMSQGRTITEADLVTFAGWSWDANAVHPDAKVAGAGRFGGGIAHRLLGMSWRWASRPGSACSKPARSRCSVSTSGDSDAHS